MNINAKDRALDQLTRLLDAHRAAVESIRIASRSEGFSDQLTVAMQTYYKFQPGKKDEYRNRVIETIRRAKQAVKDDFIYQRSMLLIALCSLLDVTVKDVVAEQLANNRALVSGLPRDVRLELERKSKLTLEQIAVEDIFSIIDCHFKRSAEVKNLNHAERYGYWLSLVHEDLMPDGSIDLTINQAFQVRNIMIHASESARVKLAAENSRFWNETTKTIRLGQREITAIEIAFRRYLQGIGTANL